jgi:hypothetical protein
MARARKPLPLPPDGYEWLNSQEKRFAAIVVGVGLCAWGLLIYTAFF